MKKTVLIFSILLGFVQLLLAQQQPDTVSTLAHYLRQKEMLLKNGGKWQTRNRGHNPVNEKSYSYHNYEYSNGIHEYSLHLKITAYLPAKSEWENIWNAIYTWDAKSRQVNYYAVNLEGTVASGQSDSINATYMRLVFDVRQMDGFTEKHRDEQLLISNGMLSKAYVMESGYWKLVDSNTWIQPEKPSGNITFMSTRDGNWEIYAMTPQGEKLKNLSCNKASDYMFSYFPGSTRFVFSSNREGNEELFIMSADGKNQTNITNNPASDRVATVSPDGATILFLSDRDHKQAEIYSMDTLGKNLRRLTVNDSYEDYPMFMPDGKHILFTRVLTTKNDTGKVVTSNAEIFVMDSDGRNERRLTFREGHDGGAQASPDGAKIAFYGKSDKGFYDIFIMDTDGKNIVNITNDSLEDYSPHWSPDGKWIAFTRGDSKNYDVWIIELQTRIKTRLTTQPRRDESPVWHRE